MSNFEDVAQFHFAASAPRPDMPVTDADLTRSYRRRLRLNLILEEVAELAQALGLCVREGEVLNGEKPLVACDPTDPFDVYPRDIDWHIARAKPNLVEAVDALIDIEYVVHGAMLELGVNPKEPWDEVQRSNMAKFPGGVAIRNEAGKLMKPANWTPPNLAPIIDRQRFSKSKDGKSAGARREENKSEGVKSEGIKSEGAK